MRALLGGVRVAARGARGLTAGHPRWPPPLQPTCLPSLSLVTSWGPGFAAPRFSSAQAAAAAAASGAAVERIPSDGSHAAPSGEGASASPLAAAYGEEDVSCEAAAHGRGEPLSVAEAFSRVAAPARIRNVAIVAHVDHGKTTLVDALLRAAGVAVAETRLLDANDLEKERGITILAKTTKVHYKGFEINIVDTPGHSDFGGEVERVLSMVDGVILVVDVQEGPRTQTQFVLKKALQQPHITVAPIVVFNKIDRGIKSRIEGEVESAVFDVFATVGANDRDFDYPSLYGSAKYGFLYPSWGAAVEGYKKYGSGPGAHEKNVLPLLEKIIHHVPPPAIDVAQSLQLDERYGNDFSRNPCSSDFALLATIVERLPGNQLGVTGRVQRGLCMAGSTVTILSSKGAEPRSCVVRSITGNRGIHKSAMVAASPGNVVTLTLPAGVDAAAYDTVAADPKATPLPFEKVDPPIITVELSSNTSPLAGEGNAKGTLLELTTRVAREVAVNPSMVMEATDAGSILVCGRGDLQLSVLFETMRREGYEFEVAPPGVICKTDPQTGAKLEPWERLTVVFPREFFGVVQEEMAARGAEMLDSDDRDDAIVLTYECVSKRLFGLNNSLKSLTKGLTQLSAELSGYRPVDAKATVAQALQKRYVAIAATPGAVSEVDLLRFQNEIQFMVFPGDTVYEGQVIGLSKVHGDLCVSVVKGKKLNVMTKKYKDKKDPLNPIKVMPLEAALTFLQPDELLEVTPSRVAIRKRILRADLRLREEKRAGVRG